MSRESFLTYAVITLIILGLKLNNMTVLPVGECKRAADSARTSEYFRIASFPPFVPDDNVADELALTNREYRNHMAHCLTVALTK